MVAFTSKCCIVWISWESVHQMPSTLITLSMLWFCFPFPFLARYDYVSHWQSWGRKWKWNGEGQSAHLVQEGTGCRKPASGQLQKEGHVQFYKSSFSYSSKPPQEPAGMITSNTWETRNGLSSKTTPYTHIHTCTQKHVCFCGVVFPFLATSLWFIEKDSANSVLPSRSLLAFSAKWRVGKKVKAMLEQHMCLSWGWEGAFSNQQWQVWSLHLQTCLLKLPAGESHVGWVEVGASLQRTWLGFLYFLSLLNPLTTARSTTVSGALLLEPRDDCRSSFIPLIWVTRVSVTIRHLHQHRPCHHDNQPRPGIRQASQREIYPCSPAGGAHIQSCPQPLGCCPSGRSLPPHG